MLLHGFALRWANFPIRMMQRFGLSGSWAL
jgi:hypothetical protein